MVPTSSFSIAPAEAGAQGRKRSAGLPWVPAFAGMTIIACGYHLLESDPWEETNKPAYCAPDSPARQSLEGGDVALDGAGISIADHPASA